MHRSSFLSCSRFDATVASVLRAQWSYVADFKDVAFTALGGGKGAEGEGALLARVSSKDLAALVRRGLELYEREERDLGMLLFPVRGRAWGRQPRVCSAPLPPPSSALVLQEVLDHIVTVDRVLSSPGGAALLVGQSGVGRRSATTLVAHMHGMHFATPSVSSGFGVRSFFVDLKAVLAIAGVAGECRCSRECWCK